MVPIGEWTPDQPDFENPGSSTIINAVPRTKTSYGPALTLSSVSGALGARCQGGIFVRDSGSNVFGFAGDATKLYKMVSGSTSWTDVSVGGGYTVDNDERWAFASYGATVIATDYNDPIQKWVLGSSTAFANLSSDAPKARYVARVKDFVMVANTTDGTYGAQPQRVWWPALGDPTNWPTPGTSAAAAVQSGFNDLLGEGGWIQGLVGGLAGADAAVFQERNVWRGMYAGPPRVFAWNVVETARGTPAPGSICSIGPQVFYLADDGFYLFDGVQSAPIGFGKVDKTFWSEVDTTALYRITSAADPLNKIIYLAYPGPQNSGGTPNRVIAYHWALQRWSSVQQTMEVLLPAYTFGYTLDQLDAFGTLETLPFSLDSRVWTGGRLNLAAFDTSHKLAMFSGPPLAATLDTSEAQLNDKGGAYVSRVWPMIDTSNAMIQVGYRDRLSDPVQWTAPQSMTATTGSCGVRATGRYHRARMTTVANDYWTHGQGVTFEARAAGRR